MIGSPPTSQFPRHLVAIGPLAAAALLAASLGGCASYKDPGLVVTDVKSVEETESGLALAFTLSATNANDVALPLRAVEYELELSDDPTAARTRRVFRGTRSPEASIRRFGEHQIVLPAVIPLRSDDGQPLPRPTGLRSYSLWTRVTYVTPGAFTEVLFDTGVRRPTVSITQTGELDFGTGPGSPVTTTAANP